jgi:hypothetical protein
MYDRLWHRAFVRGLEFLGDTIKVMSLEPCLGTEAVDGFRKGG